MSELRTERLSLRQWRAGDRAPFAFEALFTPAVELGWRVARDAWGHGFATAAPRVAASFAFRGLGHAEIVAYTAGGNARSRAVMRRLGMRHDEADDFDHPHVLDGDLRRHVLYRLTAPHWEVAPWRP